MTKHMIPNKLAKLFLLSLRLSQLKYVS